MSCKLGGISHIITMTFRIKYGHFKYQLMLLGLFKVPASCLKYINKMFAKKLDDFVLVYLVDILIYIKNLS